MKLQKYMQKTTKKAPAKKGTATKKVMVKPAPSTAATKKVDGFQAIKKFVLKHYPESTTVGRYDNGQVFYQVVSKRGKSVVNPTLLIPPATSVRKAWENAKYSIWFMNKLNKTRIQDEQKIYKTLSKED